MADGKVPEENRNRTPTPAPSSFFYLFIYLFKVGFAVVTRIKIVTNLDQLIN